MILVTIFIVFYSICVLFATCELDERLSIAYDQMDAEIAQFDWYLFPIEVQQLLPIVIMNAQQPIVLACFGSISVNRETLKKVPHQVDQMEK